MDGMIAGEKEHGRELLVASRECRLLEFLLEALAGWKRGTVRDRLKRGGVHVNGTPVIRHDHPLAAGDRVEVLPGRLVPAAYDGRTGIRVLYDDPHLIVIDKPPGLLSVATLSEHDRTAMHQTRLMLQARGARRSRRLWAVHRLDQETSGVLMFAKSQAVQRHYREHWRQVEKIYLAIVEGVPLRPSGAFAARLREGKDLKVYADPDPATSKAALSHYRLIRAAGAHALLEVRLRTGRKHQIRVHLADAGHPVVGDPLYGSGRDLLGRLALHAHRLSFTHLISRERLSIVSPLPSELEEFLRRHTGRLGGDPRGRVPG